MKNEMNGIPTPETDAALCRYKHPDWPSGRKHTVNGKPVVLAEKTKDLERRLTIARDGFNELINAIETGSFSNGEYSRCEIKQAKDTLTLTAPKP